MIFDEIEMHAFLQWLILNYDMIGCKYYHLHIDEWVTIDKVIENWKEYTK